MGSSGVKRDVTIKIISSLKFVLCCVIALLAVLCSPIDTKATNLLPKNSQFELAIKPQFEAAKEFGQNRAPVQIGEKWGYINKDGKLKINATFENARVFVNDRAAVRKNEKWGVIDKSGTAITEFEFDFVGEFHRNLAPVQKKSKFGLINKQGQYVITPQYNWIGSTSSKPIPAMKKNKFGYVNSSGTVVIEFKFNNAGEYSNGFAPVVKNGLWNYIDSSGKKIGAYKFDWASTVRTNHARIAVDSNWGIINPAINKTIPFDADILFPFREELAPFWTNGRCGYANQNGIVKIKPKFESCLGFSEHLAAIKTNNHWGYVNQKNKLKVQPFFQLAGQFSRDLAPVKFNDAWGFIRRKKTNKQKKYIAPSTSPLGPKSPSALRYISRTPNKKFPNWTLEITEKPFDTNQENEIIEVTQYPYRTPTPTQIQSANSLLKSSLKSAKKNNWFEYKNGINDNYEQRQHTDTLHYMNTKFARDGEVLNPSKPEFLMYYPTTEGKKLAGFMYFSNGINKHGPQIGGPLTVWHYHVSNNSYCFKYGVVISTDTNDCALGTYSDKSPEMLHVWFVDHPDGQFDTRMGLPDSAISQLTSENYPPSEHELLSYVQHFR